MAKLICVGRLGTVKERKDANGKEYISFGVAEPAYKSAKGDYVTPWYNFLVTADSATGKYLKEHGAKLDVVRVTAEQRQDAKTSGKVYNNAIQVERITTKATGAGEAKQEAETSVPSVDEQPIADLAEDGLDDFF
jgi:hypothetical protein